MPMREFPRKERGFSLIEALIALVIIMIGLLGVAGLQALGVRSSAQAHLRTLAALDAQSLAASMRANRAYWAGPAAPTATITIQTNASGSAVSVTPAIDVGDCEVATCTAEEVAGYNLNHWGRQLAKMQHGAVATITRLATAGTSASAYTVTVAWHERKIKGQGVIKAPSAGTARSTTVVVQP